MKRQSFVKVKWSCVALCVLTAVIANSADPRNELPKKQHKTSDAPFLTPEQAVKKMAIPEGFEVSIYA